MTYCLVPPELADRLHELLRNHFAGDPEVEVVVEMRRRERRSGIERRATGGEPPAAGERRQVHGPSGRRVGERRAELIPVDPLELPRRARRYAEQIAFVRRLEPATRVAEDLDAARLVMRFQAGDEDAFATLYARLYDRTYAYLRMLLKDSHEAEDATQEVFLKAYESLPRYERRTQPFAAWFMTVVRHVAIDSLRRTGRIELEENHIIDRRREELGEYEPPPEVVGWITDRDLAVLMERLPLPQRQVLLLRYLLGLTSAEAGRILNRSPEDVRILQHRALNFLRERLTALGRAPKSTNAKGDQARSRAAKRHAPVLRERRFVLMK